VKYGVPVTEGEQGVTEGVVTRPLFGVFITSEHDGYKYFRYQLMNLSASTTIEAKVKRTRINSKEGVRERGGRPTPLKIITLFSLCETTFLTSELWARRRDHGKREKGAHNAPLNVLPW